MATIHGYTPYNIKGDLGRAYDQIMERLDIDEWACFIDQDVIILNNQFWVTLHRLVDKYPDAGCFSCWCNNIMNTALKQGPAGNDIQVHTDFAVDLYKKAGDSVTEFGHKYHMSGMIFCISKRAWLKAGSFPHGFGDVDIGFGNMLKNAGLKLYRMNGIYVYHRRCTNGNGRDVPRDTTVRTPSPANLKKLPPLMPKDLPIRPDLKISVVISTLMEKPSELRSTIRSFREHGADEVILIDDGNPTPIGGDCGADKIIRHEKTLGACAGRNEGAVAATGNVIVWSDSHCRVRFGDFRTWASYALDHDELLCAAHTSSESDTITWGARLEWREWKEEVGLCYIGNSNRDTPQEFPACLVGSVYACSKKVYDLIGGWPITNGFGYNEPGFSLAAQMAGIPIHDLLWFVTSHRYRSDTSFQPPYRMDNVLLFANRYIVHYQLFGKELWEMFFSKIGLPYFVESLQLAKKMIDSGELEDSRSHFEELRKVNPMVFLNSIGVPIDRAETPFVLHTTLLPGMKPPPTAEETKVANLKLAEEAREKNRGLIDAIEKSQDTWAMQRIKEWYQLVVVNGRICKCNSILEEIKKYCKEKGIYNEVVLY